MKRIRSSKGNRAFSLVELCTVLAVMAIMVAVAIPAIEGALSVDSRKEAVDEVLSTIEQTRIAALQNGDNVYLVMAMPKDSGATSDAMIVVGDPPLGSASTSPILFTKWIRLPKGVRFLASSNTLVSSDSDNSGAPTQVQTYLTNNQLPPLPGNPSYTGLTFGSTGSLQFPVNTPLLLALFEGMRGSGGAQTAQGATARATQNLSAAGIYDTIRLSQYTGRAWSEVSSLNN